MNHMSPTIERSMIAKMNNLGISPTVRLYRHNKADEQKHNLGRNEHDCVSCTKHLTHKIPNNSQCKAMCGNTTKQQKTLSNNN